MAMNIKFLLTEIMKNILIIFTLFFGVLLNAQMPKANFFKLVEWGEGALPQFRLHASFNDELTRLTPLDDGYLLEYIAMSETTIRPMIRFSKIDFDLNEIWRLDILGESSVGNDVYSIYLRQDDAQEDIIIDGKLYTLFASSINFPNGYDGQVYHVIDIETGELLYAKLLKNGQDGLYVRSGFYRYQDSLFMFTGLKNVDAPPFILEFT